MMSRITLPVLVASVLLIQGCASSSVKDSDRDKTGLFDGKWQATVLKSPGLQYVGSWEVSCDQPEFNMDLTVSDGQVTVDNLTKNHAHTTNINSRGEFSFVIPLRGKAGSSSRSDVTLAAASRRLILKGKLVEGVPSGRYTVGVQQLGWQGCSTKVLFEHLSDSITDVEA